MDVFAKRGSNKTIYNMAAGGTTTDDWTQGPVLDQLAHAASLPNAERVWLTLGGNDAIEHLPFCALQIDPHTHTNKTVAACVDELLARVGMNMDRVILTSRVRSDTKIQLNAKR